MVVAVIGIIIYTFRDSARPIFNQLKQTAPLTVIGICLMAAAYQVIEGWITMVLAKQYEPSFTKSEPSGLRKTTNPDNSLGHRTTWPSRIS